VVCGTMIYPRNSQKYADRIFTRFKGDISDVFSGMMGIYCRKLLKHEKIVYFCGLRRVFKNYIKKI
jgi:fumarylacetoacetate (FAA) hydrolase family protein